ncbi:MAG: PspA/IM30 family protein [Angelakisella sp.]|jgi:phage shock protein A|nr:PspA/IM30 family protein [Angelakisella sp.]MCI9528241.1 PspA/IM30 family protein [Angelakisella sp.]
MGILDRFSTIVKANINALLDKAEDPSKMIDQYLTELMESLAEVKKETAGVMAEESRTRAKVEANRAEVQKYADLAKKALQAGNDGDARVFIAKKQQLETAGQGLTEAYDVARGNAEKMRQMHDKLVGDIEELKRRRETIKAKVAVAKTQSKLNEFSSGSEKAADAISAFERMEEKADRMLDREAALAELNAKPVDEAAELEAKYGSAAPAAVDDELARMKAELGL